MITVVSLELKGEFMIYANLMYFLVVIFVFTTNIPAKETWLSPWATLFVLAVVSVSFVKLAVSLYGRSLDGSARLYFAAEKKLSLLAVAILFFLSMGLILNITCTRWL
jgi:hypothetical protein